VHAPPLILFFALADMLEALCRLVDMSSTPSGPQLRKILRNADWIGQFESLDADGYSAWHALVTALWFFVFSCGVRRWRLQPCLCFISACWAEAARKLACFCA
jgi:hypothetical protein